MSKFENTKIRMVMKLKKLSHRAAVEEIAQMDAARKRAVEEEAAHIAARKARMDEMREELHGRRCQPANISRNGSEGHLMSAKEFFGDV